MITWAEKVTFVGMTVEVVSSDVYLTNNFITCYQYCVRVCIPSGACSYGDGHTIEEAIESAAVNMQMDWYSVERKITEYEWQRMSHT